MDLTDIKFVLEKWHYRSHSGRHQKDITIVKGTWGYHRYIEHMYDSDPSYDEPSLDLDGSKIWKLAERLPIDYATADETIKEACNRLYPRFVEDMRREEEERRQSQQADEEIRSLAEKYGVKADSSTVLKKIIEQNAPTFNGLLTWQLKSNDIWYAYIDGKDGYYAVWCEFFFPDAIKNVEKFEAFCKKHNELPGYGFTNTPEEVKLPRGDWWTYL